MELKPGLGVERGGWGGGRIGGARKRRILSPRNAPLVFCFEVSLVMQKSLNAYVGVSIRHCIGLLLPNVIAYNLKANKEVPMLLSTEFQNIYSLFSLAPIK